MKISYTLFPKQLLEQQIVLSITDAVTENLYSAV